MGYTEGMAIAEAFVKRNDGWFGKKKAECDPRYGWKTGLAASVCEFPQRKIRSCPMERTSF
jgi:hypothetical protein